MEALPNMSTRIRLRRDTAANWTSNNPTLTTGEMGYETNTGKFKIGNNTDAWTALPYSITAELSEGNLNDLKDVTITAAGNGDFLRWNGSAWINDAVNLSTDTVGSFVESLVAGTGITLTNNSGEGATPTVAVDTSTIQAKVANVTDTEIGYLDGVTSAIQTQIDTKSPLASPTFTGTVTIPSGASISGFAPLASPTFTGTVTLPDNTVALGTKTTGSYVESLVAGTGVTLTNNSGETATPTIAIGQAVATNSNVTFNNLTVSGDLTVSGTTTSINTETLTVDDNIIVLNNNASGAPSQNAGIEVERGSSTNVALRWLEAGDKWQVTENGTDYYNIVNSESLENRFAEEHWHKSVRAATTAVLPNTPTYTVGTTDEDGGTGIGAKLESSSNARLAIDGVDAQTGDRVLVKNQANALHNGVYDVTAQGSVSANWILTRATDMNSSALGQITMGESIAVREGTNNYYQQFSISSTGSGPTANHVIGTDNLTFVQYTGTASFNAGGGLTVSGNTLNVATANSARIVVEADSIDLAPITQSDNSGAAGLTFVSVIGRDGYGRVTGITTSDVQLTLGTNTTGDYVSALVAGTGVALANNSGESTTPTISIGQAVGTASNVTFASVTAPLTGNASTATTLQTSRNIAGQAFDGSANISIGPTDLTGVTATATELNYVDGVTSAIQTQMDLKAPLASPSLTGTPTAPTASSVTNSTQIATTAFVQDLITSATAANTVELGADTTGSYVTSLVAGTGVTLTNNSGESATPTIAIGQAVATNSNVTFNDLIVSGTLTVSGTTTSVNTEILTVDDNIVVLNNNVTGSPTENAGIEIERGTSTNVTLRWNETNDKWEATNDGSTYGNLVTTADSLTVSRGMIADVSTNAQTASYTLVLADKNKIVEMGVGTANTLTVPLNATVAWPVGTQINILQTGAGQTTITATVGVTINAAPGLKMRTQWSYATLVKRATDTWVLVGDIAA